MWSKPLLYRFRQSGEIPQTQASQGFAAFRLTLSRIPPRHSQSKRATNCANPGFLVIQFCSRCGQTCGQAVFLTISACGGSACIAGVSRDCGHGIFRLEGGATRSQTRRDTNFAIPGYSVFCHDTTAERKNKDFLSVVILHFSHPTMPRGKKQQEAGDFLPAFCCFFASFSHC
jgi:hypothetical protein